MSDLITTDLSESVFTITLNRPDKLNSFTESMARQLQNLLKVAANNEDVRCVLLTGNGKAFSAGQDLPEVVSKGEDYELGNTVRTSYNPIIEGIRKLEKPVVCAVNGTAAGAGANIALACDIILASEEAKFVQSFSKIGLIPDSGGTFMLPRLIGMQRTNILYMLDEKISAEQAREMGLIYKVAKHEQLMKDAREIADKLASLPTKGFGLYKRAINKSFNNSLDEQLELEANLQTKAGNTQDYREGVQSFMEKRKPEFEGK